MEETRLLLRAVGILCGGLMRLIFIALLPALLAHAARADDSAELNAFLDASIRGWANDSVLVEAINAANTARSNIDQGMIDELDATWRAEVGKAQTPTITPVLQSAAADFLRDRIEQAGGSITEIFLMDSVGLNVAATNMTSDMWQGDEDKFVKTYPMGADAVFIDEVDLDESTQTYQAQISITVVDPETQQVIGVLTVGIDAEAVL